MLLEKQMRVSYSPDYFVQLPSKHPFPMGKFPALRRILQAEGLLSEKEIVEPSEADWEILQLAHTDEYLGALRAGVLTAAAERKLGLPWSEALVRRSRLAVQGTLNAAEMALEEGIAANLAGGTGHRDVIAAVDGGGKHREPHHPPGQAPRGQHPVDRPGRLARLPQPEGDDRDIQPDHQGPLEDTHKSQTIAGPAEVSIGGSGCARLIT